MTSRRTARLVASKTWQAWEVLFLAGTLVLLAFALVGCTTVQVTSISGADTRGTRSHSDIGRVTSSEQSAAASAEIPVSVVPK